MTDPYQLGRFLVAQDRDDTYHRALSEIRQGRKLSHWMWFVFPQVAGLGHSPLAQKYAISSLEEARAYLHHDPLGARLIACARALLEVQDRSAQVLLGAVDGQKLRSCMTLFARAAPDEVVFNQVLDRYFEGHPDPLTEQRI
ncbi:MAG: DUF1810 domain-containing protein [Candidatus Dormibacteria bacterium]